MRCLRKIPLNCIAFIRRNLFSHAEGHQVVSSVTSIESIRECIGELQLTGCRLDLSEGSIDAQRSEQGGVFLVVTGNLMLPGKPYHHFVQSFFLACQSIKGLSPSYYVRNSIFRLLGPVDASSSTPAPAVSFVEAQAEVEVQPEVPAEVVEDFLVAADPPTDAPEEPASPVLELESESNGYDHEPHPDHNTVASEPEYVNVSVRDNIETVNDEELTEGEGVFSQARSVQRSFAELVKGWGEPPASDAPAPQTKPKAAKVSSPDVLSPPPAVDKGPTIHLAPETGPPSALYLNQLPEDVTSPEQLAPLFTPYGPIRKIDVHPKGYAFVNYLEAPSVAKVLELAATTPEIFTVNGHVIQVREKINKPKVVGGKDKKVGEKFKKEGWKPREPRTGTQAEKSSPGEKKTVTRTKTEKPPAAAKVSKK
jgi:hypothetical protein